MAETKKLKKNNKKQDKEYEKEIKKATEGVKPLSKPLYGKFLSLVIKHEVMNDSKKEEVEE